MRRTFWALIVMPAFPLEVHGVEVLLTHVAGVDGAAQLEDAVGERALAVVDVGDDRQRPEPLQTPARRRSGVPAGGHTPILAEQGRDPGMAATPGRW